MGNLVRRIAMNDTLFPELFIGSLSARDFIYIQERELSSFDLAIQEQERQRQLGSAQVRKPLLQFPYNLGVD